MENITIALLTGAICGALLSLTTVALTDRKAIEACAREHSKICALQYLPTGEIQ